jgi:pyridoxal phosphate enzyme (YggS family)
MSINLDRIEGRLRAACERVGRDREQITLVAVSKRQPLEAVHEARVLGVEVFAENYAQALRERIEAIPEASWDFVGHVQSNKARYLVPSVRLIHSLSTASAARALSSRAERHHTNVVVLVEVDTSEDAGEGTGPRTGASAAEARELARTVRELPGIHLRGLMALPPRGASPEASRPHFERVTRLRDELEEDLGRPLPDLSMGMSDDYEVAVEEGATLVRIGTALFGQREGPSP